MPIDATLLVQLQQNDPGLNSLDLVDESLTDEDAVQLVQALSTNTTLTYLNVGYNQIGDEGAKALSANTTLTRIDVRDTQIGDEAQQQINQMLAANLQRQQERRNGFILTMGKGLAKAHALAGTPSLPLPLELIGYISSFLDARFYLQLATIKHPAHIAKTEQQVYQCVLFLLHQLVTGNLAAGDIIERRPEVHQALAYHQHFLFKPVSHTEVVELLAKEQRPSELCPIL